MNLRTVLKNQYHASLAMLLHTIELCPDDLWQAGKPPRTFWRIAYHTLFYAHYYLMPNSEEFTKWEGNAEDADNLWEAPKNDVVYSKAQILEYWKIVDEMVDGCLDTMDIESPDSGFTWYKVTKLDHQFVNIRHIQQHTGQLSELLNARDIDTKWVCGKSSLEGAV